ncbi:putative glycosyltransferase [Ilumatobacter coccineus YM16-304]|uniref:Putative glycosyltransferase n=2 Tax=Ilumatobacter coccineus TaxID=467094 RepID=A0A6C7E0H0_ILUCY|nr:putative glycosyltransferase [Ilumatobacter coccineus YM16-304]
MAVSVIIPTFNRRDRLERVLRALEHQTHRGPLEVVVVSDGSTDGSHEFLRSHGLDLDVMAVQIDNSGPAVARNVGIDHASKDLVLFLDDDVVPEPDLVEQHVREHGNSGNRHLVVIGPMLSPVDAEYEPWVEWEQFQLSKQYQSLGENDVEPSYRQFYTGNASLFREHLVRLGGFDSSFRRAEDVELAFRLHQAGLVFRFCPTARGMHYAERPFSSWRAMAFAYGRNNVIFARTGQDFMLRSMAEEFDERHGLQRVLVQRIVGGRLMEPTQFVLERLMRLSAALRARSLTRNLLSAMYGLDFYQGVAQELGSREELLTLLGRLGTDPDTFTPFFVLEQTLGHVTHTKNLVAALHNSQSLQLAVIPVEPGLGRFGSRLPGWSNWTVRAGLRARLGLRRVQRRYPDVTAHALFVHSQVPAVLLGRRLRSLPSVVSLDATPLQYDSLGASYSHEVGSRLAERIKLALNRRCFASADRLVTWSSWAKDGLCDDYGVRPDDVTVIPPGVDLEIWERPERTPTAGPVGILFVGGDLERKGGNLLLAAAATLANSDVPDFEIHIVTKTEISAPPPGVTVHHSLTANSPELIELYHRCEIFCLPTAGDCLPMVLAEAGAAGMALVSTDVGAISEIVRPGETGSLVPVGDERALSACLDGLLRDSALRQRFGRSAQELIRTEHDARKNARRLVELLADVAEFTLPPDWHVEDFGFDTATLRTASRTRGNEFEEVDRPPREIDGDRRGVVEHRPRG